MLKPVLEVIAYHWHTVTIFIITEMIIFFKNIIFFMIAAALEATKLRKRAPSARGAVESPLLAGLFFTNLVTLSF